MLCTEYAPWFLLSILGVRPGMYMFWISGTVQYQIVLHRTFEGGEVELMGVECSTLLYNESDYSNFTLLYSDVERSYHRNYHSVLTV